MDLILPDRRTGIMFVRAPSKEDVPITPTMSKSEFLETWLASLATESNIAVSPWAVYTIKDKVQVSGLEAIVTLSFSGESLDSCSIYLDVRKGKDWNDWSEAEELAVQKLQDDLLKRVYGRRPPISFPWGEVWSVFSPQGGTSTMGVRYKTAKNPIG